MSEEIIDEEYPATEDDDDMELAHGKNPETEDDDDLEFPSAENSIEPPNGTQDQMEAIRRPIINELPSTGKKFYK